MTSRGVQFSSVVTPTIHLLQASRIFSSSTLPSQKSISVKSFLTFSLIPLRYAKVSALEETQPSRMSSQSLLHLDFSKRKMKAPPCLLCTSSQTGLTSSLKRQMYDPTGSSVGRLKCWQYAQKSSTVEITATGLRLSSKVPSPLTKCWYQNLSFAPSCKGDSLLSIIYPNNKQWALKVGQYLYTHMRAENPRQIPIPLRNSFDRQALLQALRDRGEQQVYRPLKGRSKQYKPQEQELSNSPKQLGKFSQKKQPPKAKKSIFNSQELEALRGSSSERALDKMAFHLRKESSSRGLDTNQFKLPLINRSKSQNGLLLPREVQKDGRKDSSGSFYSKKSDRLTNRMEVDEYILRHLQFLQKFQRQLVGSRLSKGLRE